MVVEEKSIVLETEKKATTEAIEQTMDDVASLLNSVYLRREKLVEEWKDLDATEKSKLTKKAFEKLFEGIIVVLSDK